MSKMNISLPDSLKAFVDEQVTQRGYGTSSEYVRELIRKDADRLHLRGLLLEGAASAPAAPHRRRRALVHFTRRLQDQQARGRAAEGSRGPGKSGRRFLGARESTRRARLES